MWYTRFALGLLDLLAPRVCPGCDLETRGRGFCPACAPLLEPPPRWMRPPAPCAAAHLYAGPMADAIRRLKYARRTDLVAPLGALLVEAGLAYAGQVARVVPVPLHPLRLRQRGFNQSALLAAPVARALGVPLDVGSLRRVRPTQEQAGKVREARLVNVRGAFEVSRAVGGPLLLVDDVRTTGATLTEAAVCLREAGAGPVRMLALAQADT